MRNRLTAILAAFVLPALLSCGGHGAAPGAAAPQAGAAGTVSGVHVPWVDMNRGQRIDYMVKTFLPEMKAKFVAFDEKRFARMDCATCHGDGVTDGSFALPNPKLPKLLENDVFAKHQQLTPAMTKFMLETVEPTGAKLLEIQEFDPATRKGLSCYNCHPREIDPTKPTPPAADHH